MPDENKTPYDLLLEDNQKLREEIATIRKDLNDVLGMNRSLLGRINSGSQDKVPNDNKIDLGKKLDGGLKHGHLLSK